jgi:hypothetical protein
MLLFDVHEQFGGAFGPASFVSDFITGATD